MTAADGLIQDALDEAVYEAEIARGLYESAKLSAGDAEIIIRNLKLALTALLKAEMGERVLHPRDVNTYGEGLYAQNRLDREAVDKVLGIQEPQPSSTG